MKIKKNTLLLSWSIFLLWLVLFFYMDYNDRAIIDGLLQHTNSTYSFTSMLVMKLIFLLCLYINCYHFKKYDLVKRLIYLFLNICVGYFVFMLSIVLYFSVFNVSL